MQLSVWSKETQYASANSVGQVEEVKAIRSRDVKRCCVSVDSGSPDRGGARGDHRARADDTYNGSCGPGLRCGAGRRRGDDLQKQ
jgi:hypothetical protein